MQKRDHALHAFWRVEAAVLREVREHRAVRVRPDLVPVRGDGLACDGGRAELERAGRAVVVAGERRVRGVLDRVAGREGRRQVGVQAREAGERSVLARPRALDRGLANGGVVRLQAKRVSAYQIYSK